ncbi:MAG: hypothetical protein C0507_02740 [Cyanobacteria bacterium PR.3.49]|jgi:ATP-dependent helicase/nuclease subunit A|nr:hypothetical protein [Cyanobacteria bacterium PR.3.49]
MSQLTEQQKAAVFSIDKNVLVSAGAGSGKTHVLVERYIEVLRSDPELTIADLVAVTFTKKAASEMRTRLKARFQSLKDSSEGEERQRWLVCMADIDGARIGTIHSLCDSILKAFPVEGGVDPKFEVLEDIERAELCEDSIKEAFRYAISSRSPEHDLLEFFSIDEVKQWLLDILNSSVQFSEVIDAMDETTDEAFAARFEKLLQWARKRALCQTVNHPQWAPSLADVRANPWKPGTELEEIRNNFITLAEGIETASRAKEITPQLWSYAEALKNYESLRTKGGNDAKPLRQQMSNLKDAVKAALKKVPEGLREADTDAFHLIRSFIAMAQRTVSIYESKKRTVHKLDYDDLIRFTFKALNETDSPARDHFNKSLRAILVDEFQDTNATQARLVASLAGAKTRLFLIGDDKQSIYKFQGADVSNFNEWKNALSAMPSNIEIDFLSGEKEVIPLNRSFRSHPDLVCGVNAVFENLLDPGDDPQIYRAAFESLDAHRERVVDTERVEVLYFDTAGRENKKSFESELICQWIEEKVRLALPIQLKDGSASRPAKFGDFAVLVQKNDHFAPLEEALTRHSIPFVTLGGKSFLMRQEVFDIENLLRFLDNEFDSHSLLGAIRSPLFSVPDDVIHQLVTDAGNVKNPFLWGLLCKVAEERRPGFEVCRQAVADLKKLKESAQIRPLGELIREILTLTNYDTVLLSSKNGRQRSRNLWKLVQLATGSEDLSPGEFARRLSLMREHKVKQADAPLQTDDVVKLMTIHASKGLEFPVVVLPFLSSKIDPRYKKLMFHKQYGIALNSDRSVSHSREKEQLTPAWFQLVKLVDTDMEAEEKKRLLYVAMTRPRDHLALFIDANEQGAQFKSFKTWLFDHFIPEDYSGQDRVSFDLAPASKVALRRFEQLEKEQIEFDSVSVIEELDETKKLLRLDLIEPILDSDAVWRAPTSRRITPGKQGVRLEATLVGTYFHSLMEHMLTRLDRPQSWLLEEVALSQGDWASHPEVVAHLVKQGDRWMEKFFDSDLFFLMKNARRRLHEIPYFSYVDEGLQDKRPDLLIEDKDGEWHLVDYKIDSFPIEEIETRAAEHLPQLVGYVRDLRSITGINCAAHLFFANHGKLYRLKAEVLSN